MSPRRIGGGETVPKTGAKIENGEKGQKIGTVDDTVIETGRGIETTTEGGKTGTDHESESGIETKNGTVTATKTELEIETTEETSTTRGTIATSIANIRSPRDAVTMMMSVARRRRTGADANASALKSS